MATGWSTAALRLPLLLLLLAAAAPAAVRGGDPCTTTCNPPQTSAPGSDYVSGAIEILQGMTSVIRAKETFGSSASDFGSIGERGE